jgi:ABC-2 type transport system permease protein/sodium transport system permease protein
VRGSGLRRSAELNADTKLVISGLITAIVFGGIPLLLAMFGRVRWTSGLGLRPAGIGAMLAAAMLGLVLWPVAHEVFLLSERLGLSVLGKEQIETAKALLGEWRQLPLWLILAALAVTPAVFEELCFRGFLFAALRSVLAADRTVIVSSLVFGLFHEVLTPGRFLPSLFLGLVLGWVRLRSGSAIPCMVLHALHNGVLLSIAYYRDELIANGWDMGEQSHLPIAWLTASALGIVVSAATLVATTSTTADMQDARPSQG